MKIFGQPESYSDMLQRIFYFNVTTGLICTVLLAFGSSHFKAFLDSFDVEADIGPISGLKALYVLVPLAVGVLSRVLKLHDCVSTLLRIRFFFDTTRILFPLAEKVGLELTELLKKQIRQNRKPAMDKTFYPYASFTEPKIDKQLVRTAADNWAWFWVFLESSLLFGLTAAILGILRSWELLYITLGLLGGALFLLAVMWRGCLTSAPRQIEAIVAEEEWRDEIKTYFEGLARQSGTSSE